MRLDDEKLYRLLDVGNVIPHKQSPRKIAILKSLLNRQGSHVKPRDFKKEFFKQKKTERVL